MLHIFAIVSTKSGSSCLMSHVEAGSSKQCFKGEAPMLFEIYSANTGLNPDKSGDLSCLNHWWNGTGCGQPNFIDLVLEKPSPLGHAKFQ